MCGVNHKSFARPGYLIDVSADSIAAKGALFTRLLAHHGEVGLTGEQIAGLLDLSCEYHGRQIEIRIEMARLAEEIEHKRGRLEARAIAERKPLLDRRAELFRADEALFFTFAARGHELLSDDQLDRIDRIYHAEKDAGLAALARSLCNAVSPTFYFGPAVTS
ncbi:hypothetical protein [Frankia sp. Cr2]|uniref:hypothetical protein n=1 Tax=Frankia sp. Cr2 TaxID=3073932 RepID=UPI002AD39742|nr:hypothetical protein [Frankia sp. Cr2]